MISHENYFKELSKANETEFMVEEFKTRVTKLKEEERDKALNNFRELLLEKLRG